MIVIVWLDCGQDLSLSPKGPWSQPIHPSQSSILHTNFIPVLQHKDKIALTPALWEEDADGIGVDKSLWLPQTACRLHLRYGRMLDLNVMAEDPFYALCEVFHFFASSEVEFLNMIGNKLDKESQRLENMTHAKMSTELSQASLFHSRRVLEKHIERINEIRMFVERRGGGDAWPRSSTPRYQEIAEKAALQLELDLEYLHRKSESLRSQGERAVTMAMSIASISEARRGIQQAKDVFKFTLLASVYVPLSFATSFMGMNVKELGQGHLSVWVFFIMGIPIFAISLVFMFVDWNKLRKRSRTILPSLFGPQRRNKDKSRSDMS